MTLQPFKSMFMDKDGGLDEIVVVIAVFIAAGLGLEFYTVLWLHQAFTLNDFGDGMAKMAVGAGAWQGARTWTRNKQPDQGPQL